MRGKLYQEADGIHFRPSMLAALQLALGIFGSVFVLIATGVVIYMAQGGDPLKALTAVIVGNVQGVALTILFSLAPVINLLVTRYKLDEDGVMTQSQLLQKTETRVGWEKVTALEERRGILGTLFGFSDIIVVAYGARGTRMHLRGIRDMDTLRTLLGDRMQEAVTVPALLQSD